MKQRITPTHFIEQYNVTDEYKHLKLRREEFTMLLYIGSLQRTLDYTKQNHGTIHTVAIWKIAKKQS